MSSILVLGGGSAGCVVAGRAVEAGHDVVLLEAGPDYGPADSGRWPIELLDARMLATSHEWGYAADRWTFERARVMGGCSSHNGAIAAVGHRSDYDRWGLPGWAGDDVEPLFASVIERMRVRTYRPDEAGPFHARCLEAAAGSGWTMVEDLLDLDANSSFGLESVNVDGTTRWNAAFGYLDPVRGNGRLTIVDECLVDRVVPATAGVGPRVLASRRGEPIKFTADTIVLSAGVYGTPAILQRSGIGDPHHLMSIGVPVPHELRGVGANLHDHPMVHAARAVGPELQAWLDDAAATGFLPEEQTLGKAASSLASDGLYDLHLFPVCGSDQTSLLHGRAHVEVACMTPLSRGSVRITSANPAAAPAIDHRYLSDPANHDLTVLRDGLTLANELLDHHALASILGEPLDPTPDDDAIRALVAHYYHPVGTAKMGAEGDADAVCDEEGRVRGVDGLAVADASLFPQIPRANTNLPALMAGEVIARTL